MQTARLTEVLFKRGRNMKLDPLTHRVAARTRKDPPAKVRTDTPVQAAIRPLLTGDLGDADEVMEAVEDTMWGLRRLWKPSFGRFRVTFSGSSSARTDSGGFFLDLKYPSTLSLNSIFKQDLAPWYRALAGVIGSSASEVQSALAHVDLAQDFAPVIKDYLDSMPTDDGRINPVAWAILTQKLYAAADEDVTGPDVIEYSETTYEWSLRLVSDYEVASVKQESGDLVLNFSSKWAVNAEDVGFK